MVVGLEVFQFHHSMLAFVQRERQVDRQYSAEINQELDIPLDTSLSLLPSRKADARVFPFGEGFLEQRTYSQLVPTVRCFHD